MAARNLAPIAIIGVIAAVVDQTRARPLGTIPAWRVSVPTGLVAEATIGLAPPDRFKRLVMDIAEDPGPDRNHLAQHPVTAGMTKEMAGHDVAACRHKNGFLLNKRAGSVRLSELVGQQEFQSSNRGKLLGLADDRCMTWMRNWLEFQLIFSACR